MPVVKSRTNKRSSSSGYSSTLTIIIFVSLCVLGVWMLSSNTVAPPKSTNRSAATTSIHSSSTVPDEERESPDPEPTIKTNQPAAYADSQGDLPEDAIKVDGITEANHDDHKESSSSSSEVSNDSGKVASSTDAVTEVANDEGSDKKEQDTGQENDASTEGNGESKDEGEQDTGTEDKKVDDAQAYEESTQTPEQESKEMKENQSEDSGGTGQPGGDDQGTNPPQSVLEETKGEDSGGNQTQQITTDNDQVEEEGPKENSDHVISDDDQQKRLEQHHKQKDDQMQQAEKQSQNETHEATIDNEENQKVAKQDTDKKEKASKPAVIDSFPAAGDNSGIPKESKDSKKSWATQADQSENEKERRNFGTGRGKKTHTYDYEWQLCNVTAGTDYIPCLDNEKAIAKLRSRKHYEHRERHCPEEAPSCLVQLPEGYKKPIEWPHSRQKIWYNNVPHKLLAEVKGHQNWVKVSGEFLTFPGGGTQFIKGALHYIDFIKETVSDIAWGKHTRVVLDVGCGVASFGGYLFDRDVLAMSFAPKDEHEAQVQFALERGIPAISAVMGTQRLPFPGRVFDLVHCARCRVPWHAEGGALLLELNRVLRPGGYFVWSATPVYQKLEEDVQIWNEMSKLTVSMCWELVKISRDTKNSIGAAIYRKPDSNDCYEKRKQNRPPMCKNDDDPNASWYVPLQACMHRVPTEENIRGSEWPEKWPRRLQTSPYWLNRSQIGIYGKPAPEDFAADYEHWKHVVSKMYLSGLGISWSDVRNIMDMRAVYGGFAAALKDLKVWVMNVVNVDSPDTLPIIYERGLIGIYHDWCESFSTYPRTYDLLHADHLFSRLKKRCKLVPVMAEVDRVTRPGGKLIVRDDSTTMDEVENLLKSLHWEVHLTFSKNQEGILSAQKTNWRPDTHVAYS